MRVDWRQPGESGPPLGLVFGAVLALGAAAAAVWFRLGLPTPVCRFREWTGVPCPTCGSTRLVQALLRGDPAEALRLNPLVFLVLLGLVLWAAGSAATRALRLPTPKVVLGPRERWLARIVAVALLVAGWAWVILRGP